MAITVGAADYLTTTGTYTNYGTCSVSFWVKINTLGTVATGGFLANRIMGTDDLWEIRACTDWSSGVFKFANELWSSTTQIPCLSSTTVVAGTWYYVVCTLSSGGSPGIGSVAQVFVNGALENSKTYTTQDTPTNTTLWIGYRSGAPVSTQLNGVLDDLRVYNRVLSANEVATIYNARGSDHIHYGLVNKWLMNEGSNGVAVSGTGSVKDITNTFNATPIDANLTYTSSFLKWRRQPWQT